MSAIAAVLHLLRSGDHVVSSNNMYGGTFRYFDQVMATFGVSFTYVDTSDLDAVRAAFRAETRLLYVETPTNPSMIVSDLRALAAVAREKQALLCVDNTFMTCYFQRPLELGAHLVVYSTTKYLNGHSDMVGGAVVSNDAAASARPVPPERGRRGAGPLRLLPRPARAQDPRRPDGPARAERPGDRGLARKAPQARRSTTPGSTHPGHLHQRQASGFGGMIAFDTGSL